MSEFDEVLDKTGAAKLLKISVQTLNYMLREKRLIGTYMRVGKRDLRFRRSKLLDYIGMEVYPHDEDFEDDDCEDAAEA